MLDFRLVSRISSCIWVAQSEIFWGLLLHSNQHQRLSDVSLSSAFRHSNNDADYHLRLHFPRHKIPRKFFFFLQHIFTFCVLLQMSRENDIAARKREIEATKKISMIVGFFMLCSVPLNSINFINSLCQGCANYHLMSQSAIILSHLNSALNPFLYAYHLKDFRSALMSLIKKRKNIQRIDADSGLGNDS